MSIAPKKYVRCWLWAGAVLIFLMVVGGITRLTDSNMLRHAWILFALGALEGAMGWTFIAVESLTIDNKTDL